MVASFFSQIKRDTAQLDAANEVDCGGQDVVERSKISVEVYQEK
jgi:hypothetical protein